jgi:hypothetical protein
MSKDKEYNTVTISNDDTAFGPVYSIGSQNVQGYFDSTITLTDPLITYNSKDLLKEFNEAKLTIQVLKEAISELGVDVDKLIEQKKFLGKLSGEENGKI